jgi:hypothetical protein
MHKILCSEIQPFPRLLQANSTKSPPLPLVSHCLKFVVAKYELRKPDIFLNVWLSPRLNFSINVSINSQARENT